MGLKRNLLAGWGNSAVSALVGLAMVPVYLHALGAEAYGLIGIFLTLQSLVQVLDLGLATTMNREAARGAAQGRPAASIALAAVLERVYAGVAALIALALGLAAPLVAAHWLTVQELPLDVVTASLVLIGVALAVRWPINLYQAVLLGTERAAVFSVLNLSMTILAALGALVVLAWRPDLRWLLGWQIGAAVALVLLLRRAAWRSLGERPAGPLDYAVLRRLGGFSAAVAGINIIGLWFMQFDKVALSRLLPLGAFSHYMIATLVVSALYQLVLPVFNVVYPRFTALHARGSEAELLRAYRLVTALVAAIAFPLAMWLMVWGEGLVRLWTGSAAIAADVAPVVALLAAGSGLHAVMYVVYALQLARGQTRLALRISAGLLLVQAPLVWTLTLAWGGVGAAAAWLLLHAVYLVVGGWITHRGLQHGLAWRWLACDVGVPLLLCSGAGTAAWTLQHDGAAQTWLGVLGGAVLAGVLMLCGLLSSPALRARVRLALAALARRKTAT